jgi:predicted Zn-dependent protease
MIYTESQCRKLIDSAIKYGLKLSGKKKPLQIEVTVTGSDLATSRFAGNQMTQNQSPEICTMAVRLLKDGRQARLQSLDLSEEGIKRLVDSAIEAVDLLEEDPDIMPLIGPKSAASKGDEAARMTRIKPARVNRFDAATAELTAADRAASIAKIISAAEKSKSSAAGVYTSGAVFEAIGNSNGLFRYHSESSAVCSITVVDSGATSWVNRQANRARDLNITEMAELAVTKAASARDPEDLTPGRYVAILEPAAVLDLLCYLWWDFAGTSHVDKLSCLLDKVGEKVFGDNISISDDVTHPMQSGSPFDGEGLARLSLTLVENGVLKGLVHSRQSAKKMNGEPTGHAVIQPSAIGEMPLNLVIAGGDSSVEQMIKQVKDDEQAVLLTRVWYVREVDPATKLLTGMTRDGTFLVQGGAVQKSVKNLRFNVSLLELLNNVIALGPAVRTAGAEGAEIPAVVPAMMVRNFNFTEGTRF